MSKVEEFAAPQNTVERDVNDSALGRVLVFAYWGIAAFIPLLELLCAYLRHIDTAAAVLWWASGV